MENSMTPAEMANSANYAAMNYGELLNTKTAYSWAIGFQIEPRLKTRRLEEMVKITRAYVTAMNGYDATREEILSCLENVGMKETHMFSSHHEVDDQTSSVREYARQDNGKSPLALPEPVSTMGNQDMDAEQESLDSDTPEKDEAAEDDSAASSPEGDSHLVVSENKDDVETPQESGDTIPMTPGEHNLVDEALDVLKTLPAPDDIDVNTPYYVEAIFAYGDSSKPGYSDPKWRNMSMKDLEAFRSATEKYEKLFLKHDVLVSTEDYLVVNESMNSIKVRMYHFPAESREGADTINSKRKMRGPKKKRNLLKEAIKQAKESSFSDETDTNVPFYDRYKFKAKDDNLELINMVRYYEDAETLSELLPAFETYASLFQKEPVTVSKDNCVANMLRSEICLVLFNIPSKKKKRGSMKKSEPVAKDNSVPDENPLITKAVEMTRTLPVGKRTDANNPYYIQYNLSITETGALIPRGNPFSKNVKDREELAKVRRNHERFAQRLKANYLVSNDNYTAFFWNNSKSLMVFYYNAKNKAEAVA